MSATARRVTRLEAVARLRGGPPGGLCADDRLALLNECGWIAYEGRAVIVADDAPDVVRAWLSQNAPPGYVVA